MGREIRQVIPNWQHPRQKCEHSPWAGGCDGAKRNGGMCYRPLRDQDFESAADEWLTANLAWESGEDKDRAKWEAEEGGRRYYWEWNGSPPDREYYRPKWSEEDATWFQVYETVSEGTPVTPPFATKEQLVDYLVTNGDFWDQHRGDGGWSRENVERFIGVGFVVSLTTRITDHGIEAKAPRDGQF